MTANAGYHAYATGDVLTAAQVQYNLQNQTVMYFATTTARDAALTGAILVEGMVSYTPATGVMYYNGTAWTAVGSTIPTSYGFTAGKNVIINGDFRVWQRGTSFTNPASLAYTTDRFNVYWDGTGATRTISQQTFTPGTAPVAGYEGAYFYRYAQSVAGSSNTVNLLIQPIEDVRVFAGQSAVLSFWAKADASRSITAAVNQNFGSGGSGAVSTTMTGTASVTTSWQRFTFTVAVPSISGKTIGTSSSLDLRISLPSGVTQTIDIWGVQLEAGSVATAFQTATGTIQGELAACQRYYYQAISSEGGNLSMGFMYSASQLQFTLTYPVTMRTLPTVVQVTGTDYWQFNRNGGQDLFNSWTLASATSTAVSLYNNTEISGTAGNAGGIASNNAATRLGFSAEL